MRLAREDWESGNFTRFVELLDRHIPEPGETDLRGWEWYYLEGLSHKDHFTLKGHSGAVNAVAWSPSSDGKLLASASSGDGTLIVWDASAKEEKRNFQHGTEIGALSWSPEGERLAAGTAGTVKVWNLATGDSLLTLRGHEHQLSSVAVSRDGRRIASGAVNGWVRIWDTPPEYQPPRIASSR